MYYTTEPRQILDMSASEKKGGGAKITLYTAVIAFHCETVYIARFGFKFL